MDYVSPHRVYLDRYKCWKRSTETMATFAPIRWNSKQQQALRSCSRFKVQDLRQSYFLGGAQDPGWKVFAVLTGSSLTCDCPKCVAAAWPLTWVCIGCATRPLSHSLACSSLSFSSASCALILICSLYRSLFSNSYKEVQVKINGMV